METEVSIDNITVMAHDAGGLARHLKEAAYWSSKGSSTNYDFDYAFHAQDGSYMDIGKDGRVRVEFNPNKAQMPQIEALMRLLKYPRLTRLDVAVDYFGVDLSRYAWSSKAVKDVTYRKRGKIETVYLGVRGSTRQHRIYDKRQERRDKDAEPDKRAENGHWRVEVEQHYTAGETAMYDPGDYLFPDLFQISMHRRELDLSHIESASERALLRGILAEPQLLDDFAKNSRTKYRKLLAEARERNQVDELPHPEKVYRHEKARLAGQLIRLMELCAHNAIIR